MRGKPAPKRHIMPDPKFGSVIVAKLVNTIMKQGKKSTAQKIVYTAFGIVAEKMKDDPIVLFETAMKNVTPQVEVVSRRVGGANYQIPTPVRGERRTALAFRWLIGAANARKGKPMAEKLAMEILDAAKGEGTAVKKRMDVQRMAEANRAFAHFAR